MEKKKLLGFYDYTVIVTYLGMIFGCVGIMMAINCYFDKAMLALMLAGVCDMFDGTIASTKVRSRREKHFGIEIDSMSDLISFGVLPAVIVYMIFEKAFIVGILAVIYILCALIRLSYFNVTEYERQEESTQQRKVYLGVPVTTVAIFLPFVYLLSEQIPFIGRVSYLIFMLLMAGGFISGIEIKKPEHVGKVIMIIAGIIEVIILLIISGADMV